MMTKEEQLALKLLEIWATKQNILCAEDVVETYKTIKRNIEENGYAY